MNGTQITTKAAGVLLGGMTDRQVRNLIDNQTIKGERFGNVWLVDRASVAKESQRRKRKAGKKSR